ncbi:hypothetical protein C8R44DRAFT_779216 [Mycena epipterygia]|nr:hypothetical protein C8R44DRAFT_779216 [Mycena epipterygia]
MGIYNSSFLAFRESVRGFLPMANLRLLAVLFTSYHAVSGSYSSPSAISPRDGNLTFASAPPRFANFTFAIPSDPHDKSLSDWIGVVCLRPDLITEDQCEVAGDWYRCPNGDVSGILVRVSAYLANLLLGIVVMYNPEEASAGVWTQLLTVYSLLISGIIALGTHNLSRFHSGMTVFLVLSPLSSTLVVYAILGFCGRSHRLDSILSSRRQHLLPRVLVIVSWLLSLALLIFTSISNDRHFTAVSPCDSLVDKGAGPAVLYSLIFVPYVGVAIVILSIIEIYGPTAAGNVTDKAVIIGGSAPFILLIIALGCALVKSRHSLAEQFKIQNNRWKLWVFWEFSRERYPFLHFCGVFLVPMIYWVIVNEIRLVNTPDNIFSPSFGQVLAIFVVLQPLLQVLQMVPKASRWFNNLSVIRLITRRPREFVRPVYSQVESQEMGSFSSRDKLVMQ